MKKEKIYISGKISGLDIEEAKRIFKEAKELMEAKGYIAVTPFDVSETKPEKTWSDYMLEDIKEIFTCDGLYMLNNWGQSKGARVEYAIAKEMNLFIIFEQ